MFFNASVRVGLGDSDAKPVRLGLGDNDAQHDHNPRAKHSRSPRVELRRTTTRHRGTGTISANNVTRPVGIYLVPQLDLGVCQVRVSADLLPGSLCYGGSSLPR